MILIRHGQSAFNHHFTLTRRDPGIEDPPLTDHGRDQIAGAAQALQGAGIRRIIVSPYTRALQTAAELAKTIAAPIQIDPLVRERFAFSCDIGSRRSRLTQAWPEHDFGTIEEVWWPDAVERESDVLNRAALFRNVMRDDAAAGATAVVSHWGFLLALTGRSLANGEWLEWHPAEPAPKEIIWQ